MKEATIDNLGEFKVTTTKLRVSDPCYSEGTWCSGLVNKVRKGTWKSRAYRSDDGEWGNRVGILMAFHKDVGGDLPADLDDLLDKDWKEQSFEVGVDSGQAGIFDKKYYRDDNVGGYEYKGTPLITEDEAGDRWYNICCDVTLDGDNSACGAGVIPFGCVSSSGYGDGGYSCSTLEKDGKVVAVMINYGLFAGNCCDECGEELDASWSGVCENCELAAEEEAAEAEEDDKQ